MSPEVVQRGSGFSNRAGAEHRKAPRATERAGRGASALTRPGREASAGALRKYYETGVVHDDDSTPRSRPCHATLRPSHIVVHVITRRTRRSGLGGLRVHV